MNTITLGQLIKKVEKIIKNEDHICDFSNSEKLVYYDFCSIYPLSIDSWRSQYDQLALDWNTGDNPLTASSFLKVLKNANGKIFEGYKGGDFLMNLDTLVYIDNYSEVTYTIITDIIVKSHFLQINTSNNC